MVSIRFLRSCTGGRPRAGLARRRRSPQGSSWGPGKIVLWKTRYPRARPWLPRSCAFVGRRSRRCRWIRQSRNRRGRGRPFLRAARAGRGSGSRASSARLRGRGTPESGERRVCPAGWRAADPFGLRRPLPSFGRSRALISAARTKPKMPGRFSVPGRMPASCPRRWRSGPGGLEGRERPTPRGPRTLWALKAAESRPRVSGSKGILPKAWTASEWRLIRRPAFAAWSSRARSLGQRLEGAGLVVDGHQRGQDGILVAGIRDPLCGHDAVRCGGYAAYLPSEALQYGRLCMDGRMLDGRDNEGAGFTAPQ